MSPNESVSVSRRGSTHPGSDPSRAVVWVYGDHDVSTRVNLSATIAQVARLDDADIVVDLSGVTFMDASTVGVLVAGRNHLGARSRSLFLRAASPQARRVLALCGLAHLADEAPARAETSVAPALGSWVEVPAEDRRHEDSVAPPEAQDTPSQEPTSATSRQRVNVGAIQQRRAPS